METVPLYAVAIFAFAFALADDVKANHNSACQEDKVVNCVREKVAAIDNLKTQQDIEGALNVVCKPTKPCTDLHASAECPEDKKKALALMESSLAAPFDALCANDGALLKKVPEMYECWSQETFMSCVEQISLTANRLDFFISKRKAEYLETLRAELSKCIETARNTSKACEGANIEPVQKFYGTFFERSIPGYSGNKATQAGSSLATFLSVVVAWAFSRHA